MYYYPFRSRGPKKECPFGRPGPHHQPTPLPPSLWTRTGSGTTSVSHPPKHSGTYILKYTFLVQGVRLFCSYGEPLPAGQRNGGRLIPFLLSLPLRVSPSTFVSSNYGRLSYYTISLYQSSLVKGSLSSHRLFPFCLPPLPQF